MSPKKMDISKNTITPQGSHAGISACTSSVCSLLVILKKKMFEAAITGYNLQPGSPC